MKFSLRNPVQKAGLGIYLVRLLLYFSSWVLQMYLLQSGWSRSLWGYAAPAYVTIIFFIGIGLIGQTFFIKFSGISMTYLALLIVFVAVHTAHASLVFQRITPL